MGFGAQAFIVLVYPSGFLMFLYHLWLLSSSSSEFSTTPLNYHTLTLCLAVFFFLLLI